MLRRALGALVVLAVLGACRVAPAAANDDELRAQIDDVLAHYGVSVDRDALIRVGEDVRIRAGRDVTQDLVAVGADVRIGAGAAFDATVVAIGGNVRLSAGAHGNGEVAALMGDVDLSSGAFVDGKVSAVGGRVTLQIGAHVDGPLAESALPEDTEEAIRALLASAGVPAAGHRPVAEGRRIERGDVGGFGQQLLVPPDVERRGDVALVGGTLDVAGRLDGDVILVGGQLRTYGEGRIDGEVLTVGTIQKQGLPLADFERARQEPPGFVGLDRAAVLQFSRVFALVNLMILASFGVVVLLFNLLLEPSLERAQVELEQGAVRALLVGLTLEIALPPLIALLLVTVVLAPVALLIVLAAALGSTVAMGLVSRHLGRRVLGGTEGTLLRTLVGYVALIGLTLLGQVLLLLGAPGSLAWTLSVLGYFVLLGAMTLGLGAVAIAQFGRWARGAPAEPPPVPAL